MFSHCDSSRGDELFERRRAEPRISCVAGLGITSIFDESTDFAIRLRRKASDGTTMRVAEL